DGNRASSQMTCSETVGGNTPRELAHMPLFLNRAEPPSRARPPFFDGRVPALLATLIALTLIGIAIWGFWVSADLAHVVAGDFFLLWLVFFGPFLFFGVAILWGTFSRPSGSWL